MKSTMKLFSLLLLVGLLAAPTSVRAEDDGTATKRFHDARIFGGIMPTWIHRDSLGPFSNDEWMVLGRVGFEWDVGYGLLVGLGYAGGSQGADVFDESYKTSLDIHEIPVSLRYRYRVFDWLEPYARVAVGPTFAHASLKQTNWSSDRLHQQGYGFRGSAGLGVEFLLERRIFRKRRDIDDGTGGFCLGFALEAGYAYRLPIAFDELKQDSPKGNGEYEKLLPQGSVDLGTLEASGVYYSLDLVMHF